MQDPMRLNFQPDIWADYDPEQVRQGLQSSAGALKGVDHEALKRISRTNGNRRTITGLPNYGVPD
jgi:hypothetical protein